GHIAGLVVSTTRDICPSPVGYSVRQPSRQLAALAPHGVPERSRVRRGRRQKLRADMIETVPSIHGLASDHCRHFAERARSAFVELRPRNPCGDDDCVIEVEGLRTTVRLRLRRVELPDLAQLSRAIAGIDA